VVFRDVTRDSSIAQNHREARILLVEDTRFYSIAIRDRLESRFGANVAHCQSYDGLINLFSQPSCEFDLAILDLCLADAPDGEALDYVLSRGVPCIVFSGISSERKRQEILAKNVLDYVPKCFARSIDSLLGIVEGFFSTSHATIMVLDPRGAGSKVLPYIDADGHPFVVSVDVIEALRVLDRSEGIQLVMLNAEPNSIDCAKFIEAINDRFGADRLRVIGFNHVAGSDDVSRFLGAGGDDFVHLPISQIDLAGRIDHMLALHGHIQALRRMASRDYLTDLLNRRYFYDRGPKLVDSGLRQGQPLCMALLDIDHFKRLNDTYGHEIGDHVLKAVANKLLQTVARTPHVAARLGGEEFGILLVGLDIEQSFAFCDLLREDIAKVRVVVEDEEISVTVSMGLAAITANETFDNYLNAADQYLYLAKHSGRNQVFSDYHVSRMAMR